MLHVLIVILNYLSINNLQTFKEIKNKNLSFKIRYLWWIRNNRFPFKNGSDIINYEQLMNNPQWKNLKEKNWSY